MTCHRYINKIPKIMIFKNTIHEPNVNIVKLTAFHRLRLPLPLMAQ
jgi:hypothetical protein